MFRFNPIFRFLASLKLAVVLMALLILSLSAGTILESLYSTEMAGILVYGSSWFGLLLFLLSVNVLASALIRFPWKRHQTGFVLAHLGILAILAGSWATRVFGVDGQISIVEGSSGSEILENRATFYFQEGDKPYQTRPMKFSWRNPSPGHPYRFSPAQGVTVALDRYYLNAAQVLRGRPAVPGKETGFAALRVKLEGSMADEDFWLFMGHPGMDRKILGPAAVVFQKAAHWNQTLLEGLGPNILAFLLKPDGTLAFRIRHRGQWGPQKDAQVHQPGETGWADMKFTPVEFLPQALPESLYEPQVLERQQSPKSALHYQLATAEGTREGWLGFNGSSNAQLGGHLYTLAYGEKQWELPFSLRLKKFHVGMNPGTSQPASYESLVGVEKDGREVAAPVLIHMNHPLKQGGYVFYQASYSAMENGAFLSVLSVARDPGVWLKYSGSLILVAGMVFMFWFKRVRVMGEA